jgi:hypothetical protein
MSNTDIRDSKAQYSNPTVPREEAEDGDIKHSSEAESRTRDRLQPKIYGCLSFWTVGGVAGSLAQAGLSREDVGGTVLRILEVNLVLSSGLANFNTAGDVEERSSKQDFEGGDIDNLNLEVNDDRTELNGVVLDEA